MMKGTILIVEDEETDVFFLQNALKKAGIHNPTQVVENGRAAIDYLSGAGEYGDREHFPMPAVIFLDLKLPQVHGLDVLKWVRDNSSLPPILVMVLTSSSLDSDIERAYRLGANSYVVKPSSPDKLIDVAKDFANWWFKHNQTPGEVVRLPIAERIPAMNCEPPLETNEPSAKPIPT